MLYFKANRYPLEMVSSFRYLERTLVEVDDYWTAVVSNLWKARKVWACMVRILWREGADVRKEGRFYLAVVQATLIFGPETWAVTPRMEKTLGGFHHWVEIQLTGQIPRY